MGWRCHRCRERNPDSTKLGCNICVHNKCEKCEPWEDKNKDLDGGDKEGLGGGDHEVDHKAG